MHAILYTFKWLKDQELFNFEGLNFYERILRVEKIWSDFARTIKYSFQRLWSGYASCDAWNLDESILTFLLYGLKDLQTGIGYPASFSSSEEWNKLLQRQEKNIVTILDSDMLPNDKKIELAKEELYLFIKEYFFALWD